MLEHKEAIFDLQMRLGEGSGAALAINLCDVACQLLNNMSTFAEAAVSTRSPAIKTEEHK